MKTINTIYSAPSFQQVEHSLLLELYSLVLLAGNLNQHGEDDDDESDPKEDSECTQESEHEEGNNSEDEVTDDVHECSVWRQQQVWTK